tara:strand:- start:132273 stop:136241 length:3969 start_codon:yes stop_codon:yes gene_type:complete
MSVVWVRKNNNVKGVTARQKSPKHSAHKVRTRLLVAVSIVVLLMAAWIVIGRQLMQRVPEFRQDLEALVEERIKTPLEIGDMSGYMDGATPVFVFHDVRLPAALVETNRFVGTDLVNAGGVAAAPLHIGRVELSVDVLSSIFQRNLRARQLLISGIELDLTVDKQGRVRLTGLEGLGSSDRQGAKPPLETLLSLIYRQKRLVVEDAKGMLSFPDMPAVNVTDLSAAIVSSGKDHLLSLRAHTVDRPVVIDVRLALQGDAYQMQDVSGKGYARIHVAEADEWLNAALRQPIKVDSLRGDIEAWASLKNGRLTSTAISAQLDQINLSGGSLTKRLDIRNARLLANITQQEDGYAVQLGELTLQSDEQQLNLSRLAASWNGEKDDALQWRLSGRDIELTSLRDWVMTLPLKWPEKFATLPEKIHQLSPEGEIESLSVIGHRRGVEQVSARVIGLGNSAFEKIPGIRGVNAWFRGSLDSGVLVLDSPDFSLDLPLLYRQPIKVKGHGPLRWRHDGDVIVVESGWLTAMNQDARGRAAATLRLRSGEFPHLSLVAGIVDGKAGAADQYIPLVKLPEPVAEWLDSAFVGGHISRGVILHEGPVKIDPDRQQDRTLQVKISADKMTLQFLPDWPPITNLSADVIVDGREIRGRNINGTIMNSRLSGASADIPEYEGDEAPRLIIHSRVKGPAADLQQLFQGTPLKEKLPAELLAWGASEGVVGGNALLHIPLRANSGDMNVLVNGYIENAKIGNAERQISLDQVAGDISFSLANGLQASALTGRLWEQSFVAEVSSVEQKSRIKFSGDMPIDILQGWLKAPWMEPAKGTVNYVAQMDVPAPSDDLALTVTADITDATITLPPPLGKRAGLKQQATFALQVSGATQTVQFNDGRLVAGNMRIVGGTLERGAVHIDSRRVRSDVSLPKNKGVLIDGKVDAFALEPWVAFFSSGKSDDLGESAFPLDRLALHANTLDLFGTSFEDADLRASPDKGGWQFSVASEKLTAKANMPEGFSARGDKAMRINIDQINVTSAQDDADQSAETGKENTSAYDIDPRDLPKMSVKIDSIVLDNTDFGHWKFLIDPVATGVVVRDISAAIRGAAIAGNLDWDFTPSGGESHFVGSVETQDVASMLRQWDLPPSLESDDLRSVMDVSWAGTPMDIDYLALKGNASLQIGESRFPKTDSKTSALRVLGVFNLGTVSRRLRFDFTDLYKKGLTCDSIGGDFQFDGPLLTTKNLVIRSPSAEFRLKGLANMETSVLDHYMDVTLPVSSGLYVGCFAGPTACAGIFVVERLWGSKLEKMTTLQYHVSGNWNSPKVEEVQGMFERKK